MIKAAVAIKSENKWIEGLDTLRFVLALIVVIGHLNIAQLVTADSSIFIKLFRVLLGNTFVGVCAVIAFFIISGIVIHYPYKEDKKLDVFDFLIKRYLRIGIPMLVVSSVALLCKVSISNFPFWSLYCELIYYTLYPLILIAIRYNHLNKLLWFSYAGSYLLIICYSSAFYDFFNQAQNYDGNYWQFDILLTWFLGLPCWLLGVKIVEQLKTDNRLISISVRNIYMLRLLILISAFICSFARFHFHLSYTISLNLFAVLAAYWIKKEILFWQTHDTIKWMEQGGKWSYSLYICHVFPWMLISGMFHEITLPIIAFQLLSALLFSYIFYLIVEKPSHKLVQKIMIRRHLVPKTLQ